MKESNFQKLVLDFLKEREIYALNIHGGPFQERGISDILMCYEGKFIALELKANNNRPSEIQQFHLEEINKNKGVGLIFNYNKEWKKDLQTLLSYIKNNKNTNIITTTNSFSLPQRIVSVTKYEK